VYKHCIRSVGNQKRQHFGGEKGKTRQRQAKDCKNYISHWKGSHFEYLTLGVKLVIPLIFTLIQRLKTGLFGKSDIVSFMNRWFIYDAMEH